ncbi:MAG: flagellar basal body P-ring formation chaperone FlgA [Gemmatimonadaceae bacterium]|jgi:flagella basal body P-ring formation protein FlgA|nr:flagellar basal body P-ring formation chaperone FlgA [Gemmatimonadaceae bacterium]
MWRLVGAFAGVLAASVVSAQMGASDATPAIGVVVPDAPVSVIARTLVGEKWAMHPDSIVVRFATPTDAYRQLSTFVTLIGTGDGDAELLLVDRQAPPGTPPIRVHAGTRTRALIATRALARGDTVRTDMVAERDTVLWGRPTNARTSIARTPTIGWIARRVIAAGERLAEPAVAPAPAITTGDPVRAVFRDGSLALALRGTATNTAEVGQRVTVRIDMRRRLDGIAVAPGVVALR